MKDLIIIGAGNVGGFLALNQELFKESYRIIGFLDDDLNKIGKEFWSIPVLGSLDEIQNFTQAAIAIGISKPLIKRNIIERIGENLFFPSFVSKNAWISNRVQIGKGVIIYPNVSINHESKIDDFTVINMNCAIGHDSRLGRCASLAPGVNLGGFTKIGPYAEIGIGSSTIQQTEVGEGAIIGGQTMLVNNADSYSTYIGVPGKKI